MRARVAVLVASLAAAPVSWPAAADGSPQLRTSPSKDPGLTVPDLTSRTPGVPPTPAWDTFSADVTIRRRMVRKDGTPGPEAPEMRYRWVRTLGDAGWKTTMTVLSVSPDIVQTSKGAQAVSRKVPVSRIEIGDARSPAQHLRRRRADALHAAAPRRRPTRRAPRSARPFRRSSRPFAAPRRRSRRTWRRRSPRGPTPATRRPIRARASGSSICCPPPPDGRPGAPRSRGTWDRRRAWCAGSNDSSRAATATPPRC